MFNLSGMDKPIIVVSGVKFADLCLILDFAYLGQAQVPHERLDDFIKAGELLQIRGIKEGRIHFMTNQIHAVHQTATNRSFDPAISSTQEIFTEPPAKRPREDDEISIQEASEIMKMLLSDNADDLEVDQPKTTSAVQTAPTQTMPIYLQTVIGPKLTNQPQQQQPPQPRHGPLPPPVVSPPVLKAKEKPKYFCRFCGRSLSTQGRIRKHENECNDNPDRVIAVCDVCRLELKPSSLNHHKNVKHGVRGKNLSLVMAANNQAMLTPPISPPSSFQMNSVDTTHKSPDAPETPEKEQNEDENDSASPTRDSLSEDDLTLLQIKQEMKQDSETHVQIS